MKFKRLIFIVVLLATVNFRIDHASADSESCVDIFKLDSIPNGQIFPEESLKSRIHDLLKRRQYQDAVWLLRHVGNESEADDLEQKIIHALETAPVLKSENLRDSTTNAKKVTLNDPELGLISAVYKSDSAKSSFPPFGANRDMFKYASHRYEIASSILDRFLGFQVVPVTVRRALSVNDRDGSLQLFMENSLGHTDLFPSKDRYTIVRPVTNQKFYALFDWLQMNGDRGIAALTNYRVIESDHKRAALIDNGLAFYPGLSGREISAYDLEGALPQHKWTVDALRYLAIDGNIDTMFRDLLSNEQKLALKSNVEQILKVLTKNNFDARFFTNI